MVVNGFFFMLIHGYFHDAYWWFISPIERGCHSFNVWGCLGLRLARPRSLCGLLHLSADTAPSTRALECLGMPWGLGHIDIIWILIYIYIYICNRYIIYVYIYRDFVLGILDNIPFGYDLLTVRHGFSMALIDIDALPFFIAWWWLIPRIPSSLDHPWFCGIYKYNVRPPFDS